MKNPLSLITIESSGTVLPLELASQPDRRAAGWRPRCKALALAILALALPTCLPAASVLWSGLGFDQNWSSADNWSNNVAPALATDDVLFLNAAPPASTAVQGAINSIVEMDFTVGTLSLLALNPNFQGIQIPAGVTLKVVGAKTNTIPNYVSVDSLFVGSGADSGNAATAYATIAGAGTLILSNAAANVNVTQTSANSAPPGATLDLSGLSQFIAYVSQVKVGNGSGPTNANRASGTLILAQNNIITCNSSSYGLSIGDSPNNNGRASFLRLGQNNSIFSDFGICIGRRKSGATPAFTDTTTLNFASGLSSPTALFRNKAGTGPMGVWTIGDQNDVTGSIGSHTRGMIDLSGGSVDAVVGTIFLGRAYNGRGSGNANSIGTLTFDAGTIAATTVEAGYQAQNNASIVIGTVNVLGAGSLVVSNDIRLGRYVTGTNAVGSAAGTLNISGTVRVGGRIYEGGTADAPNPTNSMSAVILTGGLLDLQPPGDTTAGSVTVDRLVLDSGLITNATALNIASNLTIGASGVIAGNAVINVATNAVMEVRAIPGGFKVASGQTLQGGTIFGEVVQNAGASISPGGRGVAGTLTITNDLDPFAGNHLSLKQEGLLTFDLSNDPSQVGGPNDLIVVRGDLFLLGVNQVTLNPLNGDFANGTYRLMEYYGFLSGDSSMLAVAGPISQSRRSLAFDTSVGGQVNLVVGGSTPAGLLWTGDGSANQWDLKATANWRVGSNPEQFYSLDTPTFDDTGSGSPAVDLVGSLVPTSVTLSNETVNYTFGGSGAINAIGGLNKFGAASLTLANTGSNSFGGAVAIGGGMLRLGGNNRLPTNAVVAISNAASASLNLDGFSQTIATLNGGGVEGGNVSLGAGTMTVGNGGTFDGVIGGSGQVVMNGTGTLRLGGDNTFSGGLTINTGTVSVVNAAGSGSGLGNVLIAGGTLRIGTNGTTGSIAPQPGGVLTNHGTLAFYRSDANSFSDVITGNGSVRLEGSGTIILTQNNSYTNTTFVNNSNGVLRITAPNALGTLEGGTLVNGGNTLPVPGFGGQLEMAGDVVFAPERLTLGCRGTNVYVWNSPSGFVNQSGTNTWTGPIDITTGGSYIALQSDSGLMRIAGSISGGPTATATRMMVLRGVADGEVSGVISNGPVTTALSLCKGDIGTWTLSATNLYTGATLVSNGTLVVNGIVGGSAVTAASGTLGGTGLITAPVTITAAGTLAPGASIGTLTISNTLALNGTTVMELNKSGATVSSDLVRGVSTVTYGGTLTLQLTGSPTGGEMFKLFDAAIYQGSFTTINLPTLATGLSWNTTGLTIDGTVRIDGSASNPPQISNITLSGGQVIITGTGGAPGGEYYVLASTNVALPLVNWNRLATNPIGVGGGFIFTNTVNTNLPQLFYNLQLP